MELPGNHGDLEEDGTPHCPFTSVKDSRIYSYGAGSADITGSKSENTAADEGVCSLIDSGFDSTKPCTSLAEVDTCTDQLQNVHLNSTDHSDYFSWDHTKPDQPGKSVATDTQVCHAPSDTSLPLSPELPYFFIDDDGDTQLHLAVIQQRSDVLCDLLDSELPRECVNIQDARGRTPLHLTVLTDQPQMLTDLMNGGADPAARDHEGDTALHLACRLGLLTCIRTLVYLTSHLYPSLDQFDPNTRNYQGFTCLHLAAAACTAGHGDLSIIEFLIGYSRVNLNAGDGCSGRTVLHHAADRGDLRLLRFLITQFRSRLDVNAVGHDRRTTAIELAIGRHHGEVVDILLEAGARVRRQFDLSSYSSSCHSSSCESDSDLMAETCR